MTESKKIKTEQEMTKQPRPEELGLQANAVETIFKKKGLFTESSEPRDPLTVQMILFRKVLHGIVRTAQHKLYQLKDKEELLEKLRKLFRGNNSSVRKQQLLRVSSMKLRSAGHCQPIYPCLGTNVEHFSWWPCHFVILQLSFLFQQKLFVAQFRSRTYRKL